MPSMTLSTLLGVIRILVTVAILTQVLATVGSTHLIAFTHLTRITEVVGTTTLGTTALPTIFSL